MIWVPRDQAEYLHLKDTEKSTISPRLPIGCLDLDTNFIIFSTNKKIKAGLLDNVPII